MLTGIGDRVITSADVEALPDGAQFGLTYELTHWYTKVAGGFVTRLGNTYPFDIFDYMEGSYVVKYKPDYIGRHRDDEEA